MVFHAVLAGMHWVWQGAPGIWLSGFFPEVTKRVNTQIEQIMYKTNKKDYSYTHKHLFYLINHN